MSETMLSAFSWVQLGIDNKFGPNLPLRFMTFIHNGGQNLVALVNIYKDGRPVVSTPAKNVIREIKAIQTVFPLPPSLTSPASKTRPLHPCTTHTTAI
jgi:hypothetical protein